MTHSSDTTPAPAQQPATGAQLGARSAAVVGLVRMLAQQAAAELLQASQPLPAGPEAAHA